jgi:hypothetical protein
VSAFTDPVRNKAVQSLFNRERSRRIIACCKIRKRLPGSMLSTLPYELQVMILDNLDRPAMEKLFSVFDVRIGSRYWRFRTLRYARFEIEQIPENEAVDWEFLCLGAETLLKTHHGLINRRRIMYILDDVKRRRIGA